MSLGQSGSVWWGSTSNSLPIPGFSGTFTVTMEDMKGWVDTPAGKRELLGIDLDGVLFDFVGAIHKKIPSIPLDPPKFDLVGLCSPEEKELFFRYMQDPSFWMQVPLYEGAQVFVDWLRENNYHPIVITSRKNSVKNATITRVSTLLRIPEEDIFFEPNKLSVLLGLGIGAHIEDDPTQIEDIHSTTKVFVPRRSWNLSWLNSYRDDISNYSWLNSSFSDIASYGHITTYDDFEGLKGKLLSRRGGK